MNKPKDYQAHAEKSKCIDRLKPHKPQAKSALRTKRPEYKPTG